MDTLRKQFLQHVGQTSPSPLMIEVERAEGVFFYSPDGKRYYDLIAGVTVSNVGHANPAVIEAVQRQVADYMHIMVYGETVQRPQVELASRLAGLLPAGLDSVYFLNSGSEAVEGALKLAKRHTGRTELISCRGAYHGSTHGSLSVMGGEEFKNSFRPLLPDTRLIDYNSFDDLRFITHRTAAVLVEPVQSEAGVRLPDKGWLQALRRRCDEVGAMLIFDEIQTAFGRCGAMFAMQKYGATPDVAHGSEPYVMPNVAPGVTSGVAPGVASGIVPDVAPDVAPDIVCLAKALGGGMPLGAFIASREVMNSLTFNPVLGHITTFGGHPVCCAAGLAALEYTIANNLPSRAEQLGKLYEDLLKNHPAVVEIRRSGLLLAVELGCSEKMYAAMRGLIAGGILSDWFLFCDTAFRISPPLTITEDQVRESSSIIISVLDNL